MSLRDQIHRVVTEGDPASVVAELAETSPFAGVAPDLITDAVRHYADIVPLGAQVQPLAHWPVVLQEVDVITGQQLAEPL